VKHLLYKIGKLVNNHMSGTWVIITSEGITAFSRFFFDFLNNLVGSNTTS